MKNTVWIVDDDQPILEVMKVIIEGMGYQVTAFSSGSELFKALQKGKPNLLFLDILLSGIDGIAVCKKLKSDPLTKSISVVLMSADMHIQEKYIEAGADASLKKPFDIADLEALVKKYSSTSH